MGIVGSRAPLSASPVWTGSHLHGTLPQHKALADGTCAHACNAQRNRNGGQGDSFTGTSHESEHPR